MMMNNIRHALLREKTLGAIIVSLSIILSSALVMYYSPYQSCARDLKKDTKVDKYVRIQIANICSGSKQTLGGKIEVKQMKR